MRPGSVGHKVETCVSQVEVGIPYRGNDSVYWTVKGNTCKLLIIYIAKDQLFFKKKKKTMDLLKGNIGIRNKQVLRYGMTIAVVKKNHYIFNLWGNKTFIWTMWIT